MSGHISDYSFNNPDNIFINPFYRNPDHPNYNRRAFHHDYTRPAKYLITLLKNPIIPTLCSIKGNQYSRDRKEIITDLSPSGIIIPDAITEWNKKFTGIYIPEYAIMPDHLHLCLDVCTHLPNGLSLAMAGLMGKISKAYHSSLPISKMPEKMTSFFSKGFNDRIAYTQQQWERQLQYTADNPRRYLIKRLYPNYLLKRWLLTIPGDQKFILKGNLFLLRQPFLFRVKTSRRFSPSEVTAAMTEWKNNLYNGGVPISPFIHPHEKELRDFAIQEGFSYIRVCSNGFAQRGAASGKEFELMSQGRILLIGQNIYNSQKEDLKYSYAQILNQQALDIATACNQGLPFSLRPES
ncbi:MAG: hypothetical protein K2H18_02610 [Muribaculaceae bacterium]|nr:hypothetical protein [Muribaculaceae bacterium]